MQTNGDGIVYTSLDALLKQQAKASVLKRSKHRRLARQQGQHLSIHKGRGMDFAESRPYVPGDDVRMLDWQVIARTGKAHTKLFQEERERPIIFWVDFRPNMFFATKHLFKSVLAAQVASLLAWKSWDDGDRVGGIFSLTDGSLEIRPTRSKNNLLRFMRLLSNATKTYTNPHHNQSAIDLNEEWKRLRRVVDSGAQVIMISDFRDISSQAEQQLVAISRHARLHFIEISDPFEKALPKKGILNITNGFKTHCLHLGEKTLHQTYQQHSKQRQNHLMQLARKYQASLLHLSTDDNPQAQLIHIAKGVI